MCRTTKKVSSWGKKSQSSPVYTWMYLDGHSFRFLNMSGFSSTCSKHLLSSRTRWLQSHGTFIMRVAKRKVLAVSSNILPWPKPGLCSVAGETHDFRCCFPPLRYIFMLKQLPCDAASGQMFATMVVLQLPPSESWSTGNWHRNNLSISDYHNISATGI